MRKTRFAGLTTLDPGESIFVDGSSFTARNPDIIDHFLESGSLTHHHDGAPPLSDPTTAPQVLVYDVGGALPSSTTILVAYTLLDGEGGETLASPAALVTTAAGIVSPLNEPMTELDYSAGTLTVGTYHYAVTLVDASGGETGPSPIANVAREPGNEFAKIILTDLASYVTDTDGAVRYRLYRAKDQGKLLLLFEGNQDVIEDDGTLECDCCTEPPGPNQGTTGSTGLLSVKLPLGAVDDAVGWRLYITQDGAFTSPSLYGANRTPAEAADPIEIAAIAVDAGAPPDVSTSIGGAPKLNPDTDLLNWHWKQPVADVASLPEDSDTFNGDVRMTLDTGSVYLRVNYGWQPLTAPAAHWMPPVPAVINLPTLNNVDGDVRLVRQTDTLYAWSDPDNDWHQIAGGGGGGGGAGGHLIYDEITQLSARAGLAFRGAGVTATDDPGNDQTIVTIPGDSGGGGGGGPLQVGSDFVTWVDQTGLTRAEIGVEERAEPQTLVDQDYSTMPDSATPPGYSNNGVGLMQVLDGKFREGATMDVNFDYFSRFNVYSTFRTLNVSVQFVIDSDQWQKLGTGNYKIIDGVGIGMEVVLDRQAATAEFRTRPNSSAGWTTVMSLPLDVPSLSVGDVIDIGFDRYTQSPAFVGFHAWNSTKGLTYIDTSTDVPAGFENWEGFPAIHARFGAHDAWHANTQRASYDLLHYELYANMTGPYSSDRTSLADTYNRDEWSFYGSYAPGWQDNGLRVRQIGDEIQLRGAAQKTGGAPPAPGELICTFDSNHYWLRDGNVAVVTGDNDGMQLGIAIFSGNELRWGDGRSTDPVTKVPYVSLEDVSR